MVTVLSVPAGGLFDRRDVDRHRLGRRIEVHAAVGRAAIVLHLEREAGVGRAVASAAGVNFSMPPVMSATRDELAGRDRHAVVGQRAGGGQRRDLHRQQVVGRACRWDR